ncbi:MAG: diguanylate cyclase [Actinobacteria bacterium]|nr:diguanylate cyclase [Actinomycetota bacterium]
MDTFTYDVAAMLRGLSRAASGVTLLESQLRHIARLGATDDVVLVIEDPAVGRQVFRPGGLPLDSPWQRRVAATGAVGLHLSPEPPGWVPADSPFVPAALLALRLDRHQRSATVDPLTGVTNRRGFRRALDRAGERLSRQGSALTLVVLDVDGMKELNDRAGHAAGDAFLVDLARELSRSSRATDAVARLGGDEFALLLEDAAPGSEELLLRRVERAVAAAAPEPVRLSWGAAHAPEESRDLDELLALADERMYADKGYRPARVDVGP